MLIWVNGFRPLVTKAFHFESLAIDHQTTTSSVLGLSTGSGGFLQLAPRNSLVPRVPVGALRDSEDVGHDSFFLNTKYDVVCQEY